MSISFLHDQESGHFNGLEVLIHLHPDEQHRLIGLIEHSGDILLKVSDVDFENMQMLELTPRQARLFAEALINAAERVGG